MIKELKRILNKYMEMRKNSEYVSIEEVVNDLYYLIQSQRIKRLPKSER